MAWRPNSYFIEGELDNTVPGKVTGWMRFAGLKCPVTFDLAGNFHRDIRGAKIHLRGDADPEDPDAADYMRSFATHQTGRVGDITAGREPHDYGDFPYVEWYGDRNGRVVLEFDADHCEVIGTPIPACESDPVSREEQQANMAHFLAGVSAALDVPAILAGGPQPMVSHPTFTHWVVDDGRIVGEAHSVEPQDEAFSRAFVRFFAQGIPGFGSILSSCLRPKDEAPTTASDDDTP